MSLYPAPKVIRARVHAKVPDVLRVHDPNNEWAAVNKLGDAVDCFHEGPSFDRDGNLYLVDIPFGRILRLDVFGGWHVVSRYEGWPNGLKLHADGRLFIADYRHGIGVMRPEDEAPCVVLGHRYSESFPRCE